MRNMKFPGTFFFATCSVYFFFSHASYSAPGDTTVVRTFTFARSAPYDGKFFFPPAAKRFEKVLMYYSLKCNPAQNPACGEWDYLTYTFLYEHTGKFDTTGKEILNRFELGRFITPYGIGLDLGEGWTWIYDVTDFRPLLADSVHLNAGNWQELLDLKFVMIEGTPPRDVVKIENLWRGDFSLRDFAARVPPLLVNLDPQAKTFKLRTTVTGHQFDNPTNCAEFCPRYHSLSIDGYIKYVWQILQECAMNPLYPQGGTWIYDRAGWCPGMPATTQHLELTPFITGLKVTLDYNSEYDDYGNYVFESQLVSYMNPNFNLDAAIEDIIAPNRYEIYRRLNPICGEPRVVIKNTGATILTSLDITFGPAGGNTNTYHWTGNLKFMEKQEIDLPAFNWGTWSSDNIFVVSISKPNGGTDEYQLNNRRTTRFEPAPVYTSDLIVNFKTNNAAFENSYSIFDAQGKMLFWRVALANNTTYRDTVRLQPGCYEFVLRDAGDDGISFFANNDGTGSLNFRLVGGGLFKTMTPDFGKEVRVQFVRENPVYVEQLDQKVPAFAVYPNPSAHDLALEFQVDKPTNIRFDIYNMNGQKVKEVSENDYTIGTYKVDVEIDHFVPGSYLIVMIQEGKVVRQQRLTVIR